MTGTGVGLGEGGDEATAKAPAAVVPSAMTAARPADLEELARIMTVDRVGRFHGDRLNLTEEAWSMGLWGLPAIADKSVVQGTILSAASGTLGPEEHIPFPKQTETPNCMTRCKGPL